MKIMEINKNNMKIFSKYKSDQLNLNSIKGYKIRLKYKK